MKIAIRLDDITEKMDWEKFLRFKELLCKYGIKPLLGVIPECRDASISGSSKGAPADFWVYLKELSKEGYVLAQHGVYHVYRTNKGGIFPLNKQSELAGLKYEEQLKMLGEGREILRQKGIETDIFMAPSHSYDLNTLKALKELGFLKITDGFGRMPYEYKGMTFLPISYKKSETLKTLKEGYSTLVFHTNTMKDKDFENLERMLSENRDKFISYEDYLRAEPIKCSFFMRATEYIKAFVKRLLVRIL